ncbi:hypothetical protein BGX28_009343 [Mortierella sp. GBA30]|nr:hypothetical protein BGX28_009343 [Mortierella sp. GBA30]
MISSDHLWTIVAVVLLTVLAPVSAAPASSAEKRSLLLPTAPLASDIDGAHLLLLNDVDSSTPKNAFVLLSKPRSYIDGAKACLSMGDIIEAYSPETADAKDLIALLNNNAPAQAEVSVSSLFWVSSGIVLSLPNEKCKALNKVSAKVESVSCCRKLPTVCRNTAGSRIPLLSDTSRRIQVNTTVGMIQGSHDQTAFRFLGIPYGEAPIGNLRFAAPVAKAPFQTTLDATSYRAVCPQTPKSAGPSAIVFSELINQAPENEDCLHLNVFTPSLKSKGTPLLPVLFYIHGGGFEKYSGSLILYEPGNLVSRGGVVVVTINHRLGMLGWMENIDSWPRKNIPGNQGFHDQILALRWVQKNIASFGGDPKLVTVLGQSSGATSVRALLTAPSTYELHKLYKRVIIESDPIDIPFKIPSAAARMTNNFMKALGCKETDLVCARAKTVNEILEVQLGVDNLAVAEDPWATIALVQRPTADGDLIPGEFSALVKNREYNTQANIMWGTVHDEAGLYVPAYFPKPIPPANLSQSLMAVMDAKRTEIALKSPYLKLNLNDPDTVRDRLTQFLTKYYFFCPQRYLLGQMKSTKPMYNYRFNRGRDLPVVGEPFCASTTGRVCHGADIQPVFASGAAAPLTQQTGDDARFARQVVDRVTAFTKTGNPNPTAGLVGVERMNPDVMGVEWKPHDAMNPIMEFNLTSTVSFNADNDVCSWIDTMLLYDFWLQIPGNLPNQQEK